MNEILVNQINLIVIKILMNNLELMVEMLIDLCIKIKYQQQPLEDMVKGLEQLY